MPGPFLGRPRLDLWVRVLIKVGAVLVPVGLIGQRAGPNPWWTLPLAAGVTAWLIACYRLSRRRFHRP